MGTEPSGGWRSEAKREPKRTEGDANLKKALDSMVGSSDLLGGTSQTRH
jgi:hypothetical protein